MTKTLLTTIAAALALAAPAQAGWVAANVDPSVVASDFNHRDITVEETIGTGYGGMAFVGGTENKVWLTKLAYQGARRGDGQSVWILLHETAHTIGISDEHAASIWGYQHLTKVLRDYYGQSMKQARAGYREAVLASRALAPEYQP